MKELGQVTELVRGGAGTETRAAGLLSLCPTTPRGRADACAHVHLGVQGQHCSGELGQPHAALHRPGLRAAVPPTHATAASSDAYFLVFCATALS